MHLEIYSTIMASRMTLLLCWLLDAVCLPVELTQQNFEELALGSNKQAFVRFKVPWCGFCKKNDPGWHEVAKTYENSPNVLIADVDCDGEKPLCQEHGISEYPKWMVCNKMGSGKCNPYEDTLVDKWSLLDYVRDQLKGKIQPCNPETRGGCSESESAILDEVSSKTLAELKAEVSRLDQKFQSKKAMGPSEKKQTRERRKVLKSLVSNLEGGASEHPNEL